MDASLTALFADPFVARGLAALLVKVTVLAALGLAAAYALRRESAARRHLALALVLGGLVVLPVLEVLVPAWYAGQPLRGGHATAEHTGTHHSVHPALAPLAPEAPTAPLPPTPPLPPEAPLAPEAPMPPLAPVVADGDDAMLAPAALATVRGGADANGPDGGLPVVAQTAGFPVRGFLLGLWLAGSLVAALYFAAGRARVLRWGYTAPEVDDAAALHAAREIIETLGIRRRVRLVWTDTATPMTWGVLRPVVALPLEARRWSADRLRIVLMHELTHVARFDALTQSFAHAACTLFWFHPLVWMAAKRLTQERELACDDAVLERGARASSYAQHLLDVAKGLRRPSAVPVAALAMARQGELEGRLCAILATGRRRGGLRRIHAFGASLLVIVLVLPLAAFKPWDAPLKKTAAQTIKSAFSDSGLLQRAAAFVGLSSNARETPATPEAPKALTLPAMTVVVMTDDTNCTGNVRPGGTLTLRTDVGSVEIRSWDRSTVQVDIEQNLGERFRNTCRIAGGNVNVEGRLDRSNRWQWGRNQRVRYTVRVPARYNLDVNTSGGSVSTGDLDGRVILRTSGGSLSMGDIKGTVRANTSGGSISLERASGAARLETSGGSVSVGPVGGDLYVHTSGGSVSLDGGAAGAIDASTSGGTVAATLSRQPRGDVRLSTSGGSVRVGLANGLRFNVDASTSAGRVRSDFHTGRPTESLRDEIGGGGPLLRLRTSAGNIEITRDGRTGASGTRQGFNFGQGFNFDHDVALTEADRAHIERELENLDAEIGNVDVALGNLNVNLGEDFDARIRESVRTSLAQAQRELKRAQPEIDRALREALPQAQQELQRALREVEREQTRAQREVSSAHAEAMREAARALREAEREVRGAKGVGARAREEALREARRAHEEALREGDQERREALREAEEDRQEALREAREEQQEALHEAQREQQEALREAQRDREEAQREAQQAREEARREALRAREETRREAERLRSRSRRSGNAPVAAITPAPAARILPTVHVAMTTVKKADCSDAAPVVRAFAAASASARASSSPAPASTSGLYR